MKKIRFLLFLALIIWVAPRAAVADIYLWTDPDTGMRASFPDDWQREFSADKDERLTIRAPLGDDHATCHFHARDDGRALIYPYRYLQTVSNRAFDESYWDHVMMGFRQPAIYFIKESSPIDRAWATYAFVEYSEPRYPEQGEESRRMRSAMFAGFYGHQSFLIRCAAVAHRFDYWMPIFASIVRAMEFKNAYQDDVWKEYRNFLNDPIYIVNPREHGTTFVKSGRWDSRNFLAAIFDPFPYYVK